MQRKLRYFFRNINIVNILLISAVVLLVSYSVLPMFNVSIKYIPPEVKKIETDMNELIPNNIQPPSDYTMISEENLFHPERKIPVEKKEEPPLPKPEFVLYGTLITDNISLAYLEDLKAPYSTPGRGKRQTALKKGETMSGFVLKEVETDKIVMVRGEDMMVVNLIDSVKAKSRGTLTPTAQITPPQPASTPPKAMPAPTTQKTPSAQQQSVKPPPKQAERIETKILPPQNPEEQSIINFIEKGRQNR
ncbi:MAG: hypothetical protein AB1638_03865 [Nitrospirota bacterium]